MPTEADVLKDLAEVGGSKSKLMQKYSDEQKEILNKFGGNIGDLPMNQDNPYHLIQDKIQILHQMSK